jgi:hypothetical protein
VYHGLRISRRTSTEKFVKKDAIGLTCGLLYDILQRNLMKLARIEGGCEMADEDLEFPPEPAPDDQNPVVLPPRVTYPPPPEVTFNRPPKPGQTRVTSGLPEQTPLPRREGTVKAGAGLAAGVTFAASIIAGFFIGQFLDGRLHDSFPWGTLIFTLLGVAAGFLNLMRLLDTTDRNKRR